MTSLTKLLVACATSALVLGCTQTKVQAPPVAAAPVEQKAETERWAWQPIARDDLHFLLPQGFSAKSSFVNSGEGTYEVGYYRAGETALNWTQAIRLVGYRGFPPDTKTPAQQVLKNIAAQVRNACPTGFMYEDRPTPVKTRAAAVMGCRVLPLDPTKSAFGYYLSEQGQENVYMFIHESHQDAFSDKDVLPKDVLAKWQGEIDRSLICRRGGECAIQVPKDLESEQFLKALVPVPPDSVVRVK